MNWMGCCKTLFIGAILLWMCPSASSAADCTIVADSLAAGLSRVAPECEIRKFPNSESALTVIALGNDYPSNPKLEEDLRDIRACTRRHAVWVLPVDPRARSIVLKVAAENNDFTVAFTPGKDGKPDSYYAIRVAIERWAMNSYWGRADVFWPFSFLRPFLGRGERSLGEGLPD